jgi:DNA polymerase
MASRYHGRPIAKGDPERQDGKTIELACGFGMGGDKLQARAKSQGVALDGKRAVDAYRETHPKVVYLWDQAKWVLDALARRLSFEWALLHGDNGRLYHPNGSWLDYSGLKWEVGAFILHGRRGWSKMYGAKLVENVVQWLSRIVTAEAMCRFEDAGYPIVGMSHDDVWLLVDRNNKMTVQEQKAEIIDIMRQVPDWAPGLPLDADCKTGKTYS